MNLRSIVSSAALALTAGCAAVTTSASSELPAEARQLDMLVGRWVANGEQVASDTGARTQTETVVDARWELGGTALASRSATRWVDPEGTPRAVESYAYYLWDPGLGKIRTQRFDSAGNVAEGTMTFDDVARTWHLEETTTMASTGQRTRGSGTLQYLSDGERIVEWRSSPERGGGGYRMRGRGERVGL